MTTHQPIRCGLPIQSLVMWTPSIHSICARSTRKRRRNFLSMMSLVSGGGWILSHRPVPQRSSIHCVNFELVEHLWMFIEEGLQKVSNLCKPIGRTRLQYVVHLRHELLTFCAAHVQSIRDLGGGIASVDAQQT